MTSYLAGLPKEAEDETANVVKSDKKALTQAWSNFNTGNHDNSRLANRFGHKLMDAMNMIVMLLQGTPITYYGDEIGMMDSAPAQSTGMRSGYRTPMQWTAEAPSAGFSTAEAWLPVNPNYVDVNVEAQEGEGPSHLKVFKQLAKFRHHDAVLFGETEFKVNSTTGVFAFTRIKKGNPGLLVAVNFGDEETTFDAGDFAAMAEKGNLDVAASSFDTKTE